MSWTYIEDIDEKYAPPERPLLRVSVLGELLSIAIVTPDPNRDMAYEEQAQVIVPLNAVSYAIAAGISQFAVQEAERRRDRRSEAESNPVPIISKREAE